MTARIKSSYHPCLLVAFYLNCLPDDLLQHIPGSTKYGWSHKDHVALVGYDWYMQNRHTFDALQQVATSQKLLKINKALLRVIALQKFIRVYAHRIKDNIYSTGDVVLSNLGKVSPIFGVKKTLRYLQQPYCWYLSLKRKNKCHSSIFSLCRVRHPSQLLTKEINTIKAYCSAIRFLHWPLSSVYYQMRRDRVARFTLSTFYKYVCRLHLKRSRPRHRRKNHHIGIRATAAYQILHADSTVFKTLDNAKNYIYLIQDNFSRAILGFRVEQECKAIHAFENLQTVIREHLIPAGVPSCELITDDGSENAGPVKELIKHTEYPAITHLIAQRDIEFSNSMIEA
ncbi:MAG: hypothetical protein P4L51_22725 [Puia sp.]|nr:hypothetical protein [Puia sp.]